MKFDDDTAFWKAQLSVQPKKTSVLEYYRRYFQCCDTFLTRVHKMHQAKAAVF